MPAQDENCESKLDRGRTCQTNHIGFTWNRLKMVEKRESGRLTGAISGGGDRNASNDDNALVVIRPA
jgi:hypothetical protein